MSAEIDNYIAKRAAFDDAALKREAVIAVVATVYSGLQRPDKFMFANIEGKFPAEIVMGTDSVSADARTWPTAQHIQDALAHWHKAKFELDQTWRAIPQDQRSALKPPPGMLR